VAIFALSLLGSLRDDAIQCLFVRKKLMLMGFLKLRPARSSGLIVINGIRFTANLRKLLPKNAEKGCDLRVWFPAWRPAAAPWSLATDR
jgi:hypothetical protein